MLRQDSLNASLLVHVLDTHVATSRWSFGLLHIHATSVAAHGEDEAIGSRQLL